MRTIIELSRGFLLIAVFCYIATVVMALPLGVPGIVPEEWCLVPLGAGAITLGLGMIGEVATAELRHLVVQRRYEVRPDVGLAEPVPRDVAVRAARTVGHPARRSRS